MDGSEVEIFGTWSGIQSPMAGSLENNPPWNLKFKAPTGPFLSSSINIEQ